MRYADTLLADGESILLRTRQHPLALLADARHALAAWVVTILAFAVILVTGASGAPRDLLAYLALAALLVGLVLFLYHAWQWWAQDFLITNRRVIKVHGVLSKEALDSGLDKINDAELRQSLWGRLLGYGNLQILTAAEAAVDHFDMLRDPVGFKKAMLNAKHEYELDLERGPIPSPPLRAGQPSASVPMPAPPEMVTPAPPAAGTPAPATQSAEAITATLGRLAELRDQGAITPDEYEAKKRDLLARL